MGNHPQILNTYGVKTVVNMKIKRCEREHGIVLGYQTHETIRLIISITTTFVADDFAFMLSCLHLLWYQKEAPQCKKT
jgi:hypothetical protein